MTKETNLQIIRIREVCMNRNLQKVWGRLINGGREYEQEPVRLADVLLAMPHEMELHHEPEHLLFRTKKLPEYIEDWHNWNLRKDSLEEQEPDTIQFLADLLAK